jgi:hypothetical protein
MGEAKKKARTLVAQAVDTMVVDTGGGRMQVRWDETAQATPHGQLVFFAEFLRASGVFDQWVEACPLVYRSGNAPAKRDVLGTLMLSILAGHRRYAHITAVRGDAVAAQALGIAGMVSEDAVRRALKTIEAPASEAWMRPCLMRSVASALDRPWVLDIDASVKPLYGHQQGAEVGYNPHKPGRPSHVLHTYWVGNLRLVLDVQLNPGKQHTSVHAKAGLERLLEELGDKRPALVRGDCGYGNEGILGVLGGARPALPAAAAPDQERAAADSAPVRPAGLDASGRARLAGGRRPAATPRLEPPAPGGDHPAPTTRSSGH